MSDSSRRHVSALDLLKYHAPYQWPPVNRHHRVSRFTPIDEPPRSTPSPPQSDAGSSDAQQLAADYQEVEGAASSGHPVASPPGSRLGSNEPERSWHSRWEKLRDFEYVNITPYGIHADRYEPSSSIAKRENGSWSYRWSRRKGDDPTEAPQFDWVPEVGELYIHAHSEGTQIWTWCPMHTGEYGWTPLRLLDPHPEKPKYVLANKDPILPSWVKLKSGKSYQSADRRAGRDTGRGGSAAP